MSHPSNAPSVDPSSNGDIETLSINTIRFLSADGVERAKSGHPGMPMGMAPAAYVLWSRHMKHNPADPDWPDRDRFILSAGHGSMLLYSLLHLSGYRAFTMDQLKNFRQWGSLTAGHPENFLSNAIETTTGPLGQGFANGVGMAIAEKFLAAQFNKDGANVVDHYTYGICSDGDLMEGISHEAASLAGHLGLGKLIFLYDDNKISIDGSTELSFTEDVGKRFEAYNWQVLHVADGNDTEAIDAAIREAKADTGRPTLISVRTVIGYGSPNKAGTSSAHGEPLGEEELRLSKRNLGWPEDRQFYVPDGVYEHMRDRMLEEGSKLQKEWQERVDAYAESHSDDAARLRQWLSNKLPEGWEDALPVFEADPKGMATRASSGKVLGALGPVLPQLIGGSADLTPSNKTDIKGRDDFQKDSPNGAYIRWGVREHAMASAGNGIALHGGLIPYGGTFLIFSDYMRPAIRLAALMGTRQVFVFTHDSIGLGEDGPTHQPIEHVMSLRAIPGLTVLRPADANEVTEAWRVAIKNDGPTALALTRQNLPTIDRSKYGSAEGLRRGAYVVRDAEGTPDVILIGTGSELQLCIDAAEQLAGDGVQARVVSMPSWELFEKQDKAYREDVLPPAITARVAVEAGTTFGWERYVGLEGRIIGMRRFGASAPAEKLFEEYGFTVDNVVSVAREAAGK